MSIVIAIVFIISLIFTLAYVFEEKYTAACFWLVITFLNINNFYLLHKNV